MATQTEQAIAWARRQLGTNAYKGRCQAFVADAFSKGAGMTRRSAGSAKQACAAWRISTSRSGIPAGAAVYFDSPTSPQYGHVGLCIGGDQVIHAFGKVKLMTVSSIVSCGYAYKGWGWNGGVKPSGAGSASGSSSTKTRTQTNKEKTRTKKDKETTSRSKTVKANASGTGTASSGSAGAAAVVETSKEITTVVSKSVTGSPTAQKVLLTNRPAYLSDGVEILIQHDKVYLPVIAGEVKVEWSRKGAPGKLTFTCLKDGILNFQEGNPVTLRFNGTPVFAGFVFKKSRQDALQIEVTAYDQIRYLKNEDTISYTGKTYADVLKMVAADYHLSLGTVADTRYKIPARIEEGTLLDALQNASDLTVMNTGVLYVLYDDFGKLTLKPLKEMILNVAVDEDVAQGYDYSSSIDKDTYNKIKLAVDNGTTGQRETHVLNDPGNQAKWGQLQYYEKLDGDLKVSDIKARAKILLDFYNKKRRSLTVRGVFGNVSVRGGSLIVVNMGLGDISVKNYMCVEKVTHTFAPGLHTMDVQLSGIRGEFVV